MKQFIFAYGSLMCPESCYRTLNRHVQYKTASLNGFERVFNAVGSVYSETLEQQVDVKFANLINNSQKQCHGLVFEVNDTELEKLKTRESIYHFIDVSHLIHPFVGQVFTFIAPETKPLEGYILKRYLKIMDNAVQHYPEIYSQIKSELKLLKEKEILEGGFLSVSGQYK